MNKIYRLFLIPKFLLLALVIAISNIGAQSILFKNLSVKDGLSNNDINCVLQDKNGFIWFGTEDGLNRFDGYNFKVYRSNPDIPNSISSNSIWSLFEDDEGFLWVGTKAGELNKYDPYLDKFTNWSIDSKNIKENSITSIYKNSKNEIWIGTYRNGLYKLNLKTGKSKNWNYNPSDLNSISNNFITSILEDNSSNIWISTYNGLNKLTIGSPKETFKHYFTEENENSINNNLIWLLSKSTTDTNSFWICTAGGLTKYDFNNDKFTKYNYLDRTDLQFSNSISSITEEVINGKTFLWLGTYAGILKVNLSSKVFQRYLVEENKTNGLVSNQINRIIKDQSGVVWFATEDGINYYSSKSGKFNYLNATGQSYNLKKISNKNIRAICNSEDGTIWLGETNGLWYLKNQNGLNTLELYNNTKKINIWSLASDGSNNVWIGTYGQGLKRINTINGIIKSYNIQVPGFKTSAFDYIKSLFLDKNKYLWIGFWGGGVARLNTISDEYTIWRNETNNPKSLSYNDVWSIHQDKFGRIWIGTNGVGINLFNQNDKTFYRFDNDDSSYKILSRLSIRCIYESQIDRADETILWIGTSNGLIKLTLNDSINHSSPENIIKEINQFSLKQGLIDNNIKSILEDNSGNLWLGTNSGITVFDINKNIFTNYDESDGLAGDEINSSAALKTKNDLMLFGSTNGLILFKPTFIQKSEYKPKVVLTDFHIFNENIKIGNQSPLKENITSAKRINLSYDQSVFSFQFAALDYNSPNTIQYAYKMIGFDKDWIYSGTRRFVTYTNLNPGDYTFQVRASNSDGVWFEDNIASISIAIDPPWWRTVWAYILYGLIVVVGLLLIRRIEINRVKLRNEIRIRDIESEKLKEVEKIKSRFFANLSHEFRTPLMLIKGPIEQLLSKKNINQEELLKLIQRNSEQLQSLIDQLLELSQLESDLMYLRASKVNLIPILKGIFYSFSAIAEQKNISLDFFTSEDSLYGWVDADKLEKIVNNLLSNAIKFTSEKGTISLNINIKMIDNKKIIQLSIQDSGIGIPEHKIERIFDRFYQVDDSSQRAYGGSGIGLSLVRELVELHKWQIVVKSEVGIGTEFIVEIPMEDNYLNDDQKLKTDIPAKYKLVKQTDLLKSENVLNKIDEKQLITSTKLSILIVEDSEDVQIYLREIFQNDYNILISKNGTEGYNTAVEFLPDLIISDVMMPEMNGIEFCKIIKSDWKTSHIPVILLTAKALSKDKIEGLETGADDYITKPFSLLDLSTRIKNLIEQRQRLREKFSKDLNFKPENITINKADQEFLQKAIGIVEKNISEINFDSEKMAQEMFLSRSQLHRKLQLITKQSTGEFIRTIRLKKAAGLILEKKLSVTQIAFEVGFSSPSHFTKAFKQLFNCLPSDFININNT